MALLTGIVSDLVDEVESIVHPVKVQLIGKAASITETERAAPEFGSWQTFKFAGTAADIPQMILPLSHQRERAMLIVNPGGDGTKIAGVILVGTMGQVMNRVGGELTNGCRIEVQSEQAIWAMSDQVNALNITVLDERYREVSEND